MKFVRSATLIVCASTLLLADVANMSGTWALNVRRSAWGNTTSPTRVDLVIEHNEPSFKYKGTSQTPNESAPSTFEFSGAIDDKEYTVKENRGQRKVRFKRTSDNAIEGVYFGPDGKTAEHTTMRLLRDGKTLVRQVRMKLPDGTDASWTEVYEKQQQ
jgi:hypothetical protein